MAKNKASSVSQAPSMEKPPNPIVHNCLWIAASALGLAIFLGDGMGSLPAKITVCIATLFAAIAPWSVSLRIPLILIRGILFILLLMILALPVTRIPGYYLSPSSQADFPIWLGLRSMAAVAGIACWFLRGRIAQALLCLCCIMLLLAGYWTLRASPQPSIDVFFFFRTTIKSLWEGTGPYVLSMPNIYGAQTGLYAPELIQGNTLRFGFPYPLGALIGPVIGDFFFGDYRLGNLVLYVVVIACLGFRGTIDRRIALLALFFPRLEFILEQGWSDSWSGVLLLGAATFTRSLWGGACAGLWIASKQYLIPFALPWMCDLRKHRPSTVICLGVACAFYLLPLISDSQAYLWSVFGLQFIQPFRPDSLSFLFGPPYLMVFAIVLWLIGFWPRCSNLFVYPTFSAQAAMGLLHWFLWGFFIFNKQAFANYFFTLYLITLWVSGNYFNRRINP